MNNNIIIEIGAFDGEDTEKYSQNKNNFVYCFEPNKYNAENLRKRFYNKNNIKIIEKAVGTFNGREKFYVAKNKASSSLNKPSQYSVNNKIVEIESQYDVDVIRLDTFIEQNNIICIDYFHCDAQGSDFGILKSLGNKIHIIKKGQVEGSRTQNLYKTENNYLKIIDYLEKKNFIILNKQQIEERNNWFDLNILFIKKEYQTIL